MSGRYATKTEVPVERSRGEIERTLARYGATSFLYGWQQHQAVIGFVMRGWQIRLLLPMPDREDRKYQRTPTGVAKASTAGDREYDQDVRQAWRALALVVKAKLEAVEAGIVTFEQEWAMHAVLPGNVLVADVVLPGIAEAYATGAVPELLPPSRLALGGGA